MAFLIKRDQRLYLPMLTLILLGISVLGNEWTYAVIVPLLITYLVKASSFIGFVVLAMAYGLLFLRGFPKRMSFWICFWLGVYVLIVVEDMLIYPDSVRSPWVYVSLGQAIICGFIGCRIGQTPHAAEWILTSIARLSAVVSLYMFIAPEVKPGTSFPSAGVGWPVRLFILFGFCWYVSAALSVSRLSKEISFGVAACTLEVFVAFHKPIVFAGLGSIAVMALLQQAIPKTRARRNFRIVGAIALLAITLSAALSFAGGSVFEGYRELFYTKYLHMNASGGEIGLDEGTFEHFSGGRYDIWQQAIDRFWESPWVGSGIGQTFYGQASDQNVHAHNGYLELLYSVGIFGALAHLVGAWIWLRATVLAAGLARRANMVVPIAAYIGGFLAFECGGGATVFHSLLSFVALLMGIALGYSVSFQPATQLRARQREFVPMRVGS